jgi:hypothetical protein
LNFPETARSRGTKAWERAVDDALDRATSELSAAIRS